MGAQRKLSLTPRSSLNSQARATRRKRSPPLPKRRMMACPRSPRPRTLWQLSPRAPSTWGSDYKFNSELTMVFMSCNLVGGMFQRLEKMKKNAFASAILFGENNNSSISGIWVWKGQELAFDLCEDWAIDSGSYDWKKLDPKSEDCKNH